MDAAQIIETLDLQPHPEGGHYTERWRAPCAAGSRAVGTAIYFLLKRGESSRWHRIDATEIWHFYAGSPLRLEVADADGRESHVLGTDLLGGQRPQIQIPPMAWQSAVSQGDWSLVGCTVSPAFMFEHFEMAEPGWEPS